MCLKKGGSQLHEVHKQLLWAAETQWSESPQHYTFSWVLGSVSFCWLYCYSGKLCECSKAHLFNSPGMLSATTRKANPACFQSPLAVMLFFCFCGMVYLKGQKKEYNIENTKAARTHTTCFPLVLLCSARPGRLWQQKCTFIDTTGGFSHSLQLCLAVIIENQICYDFLCM